jgi:hypothetical protein
VLLDDGLNVHVSAALVLVVSDHELRPWGWWGCRRSWGWAWAWRRWRACWWWRGGRSRRRRVVASVLARHGAEQGEDSEDGELIRAHHRRLIPPGPDLRLLVVEMEELGASDGRVKKNCRLTCLYIAAPAGECWELASAHVVRRARSQPTVTWRVGR